LGRKWDEIKNTNVNTGVLAMGTVFKRPNSKNWYINYTVDGKRKKKSAGPSKHLAQLKLAETELKIQRGELGILSKDSDLEKLFYEYLKYSKTNHSPATIKRYRAIIDNFKNFLKQNYPTLTKISQLNCKVFEEYKPYRQKQKAMPKTINMELQTIQAMFKYAIKLKYANSNPLSEIEKLKVIKGEEKRFLSKDECSKLLSNCGDWLYPIFYTFLHTGMRKQELMNLEWRDVDLDRKIIRIKAKAIWTPKTSERVIPINDNHVKLLHEYKEKTRNGRLVFHDGKGGIIPKGKLRKKLKQITKKLGFPDVTMLHTLRHTYASHLIMSGADLPTVKELLGHSDINTTMIYSHLTQEHLKKAVEKLKF